MAATTPVPGAPAPVNPATPPSGGASAAAASSATTRVAGGPARASVAASTVTSAPSTHSGKKVSRALVVLTVVLVLGTACLAGWFVWKTIHTPSPAATSTQDTPASQVRAPNASAHVAGSKTPQVIYENADGQKVWVYKNDSENSAPVLVNSPVQGNLSIVHSVGGSVYLGKPPSPDGREYVCWLPKGKELFLPGPCGLEKVKVRGVWVCSVGGEKTQLNYVTWGHTERPPILCDGLNRESGKPIYEDKGKPESSKSAPAPDKTKEAEKPQAPPAVAPHPTPEKVEPQAAKPSDPPAPPVATPAPASPKQSANRQTNPLPPKAATDDPSNDPSKAFAVAFAAQQKKQMEESAQLMDQLAKNLEDTNREIDALRKHYDPDETNRRLLERLRENERLPPRCPEELRTESWTCLSEKEQMKFFDPNGTENTLSVWWITDAKNTEFFVQDARRKFWKMVWNEDRTKATCVPYKKKE